ncbi:MAG: hypothetical protein ACI8UO_001957 [Verrucomicrobiales bacterium]|jgi:hypothetical protein
MVTLEEFKEKAMSLPEAERLELAGSLLASCPDSSDNKLEEIQVVWDREIMRRAQEMESGEVKGIPATAVLSEIDTEFGWNR